MQATTHDIFEFSVVDIMRGSKKLEQWIKYRKGNLRYALASYNGGTFPPKSSYDYADNVIKLARKLEKSTQQKFKGELYMENEKKSDDEILTKEKEFKEEIKERD